MLPLSELSADLAGWRETGKSKEEALANQIYGPQTLDDLERLFAKGFSKRALNHVLWNGKDDNHASTLNMRCGVHSTAPTLGNAVVLNLPHSFDVTSTQDLKRLAAAFVEAWEPDWMAVTSQAKLNECGTQRPFLDKALYVKPNATRPSVPVGVTEEKLSVSQGALFLNVENK